MDERDDRGAFENPYQTPESTGDPEKTLDPEARDFELASRWSRLGAVLVDGLLSILFTVPGAVILWDRFREWYETYRAAFADDRPEDVVDLFTFLSYTELLVFYAGTIVLVLIYLWTLTTRGQTWGKMAFGIRIVRFDDGSNPGFLRAFLVRYFLNYGVIQAVPLLGPIYGLVDPLFIFRRDRRCVHDLLAGTVVVKVRR